MPTIAFATPKGGAGKTTSAIVLASEFVQNGSTVTMIDADPNRHIARWAAKPDFPDGITVIADVTEDTIIDHIEAAEANTPFVIIDLEGTASVSVSFAISRADHVIIPCQGSQLDAEEAVRAVKLIKQQERAFRREIPFSILFTRTNPAIQPRTLRHIQAQFADAGIDVFNSEMTDREAFRAILSFGGTIYDQDPQNVSGLDKATKNARAYAEEVVEKVKENDEKVRLAS